jgi:hypothetical protein
MHAHVVAGGIDPFDVLLPDPGRATSVANSQSRRLDASACAGPTIFRGSGSARRAPGDVPHQSQQALPVVSSVPLVTIPARADQCIPERGITDGLEQIIEGVRLECPNGEIVRHRDEDDDG